jgi:hypothetical protein
MTSKLLSEAQSDQVLASIQGRPLNSATAIVLPNKKDFEF